MTARILGKLAAHSPPWYLARVGRIGGSDIATACGWSPWHSRAELLEEKSAVQPATASTAAQERGNMLEPAALAWLSARKGVGYDAEASVTTWLHETLDWAMFTPDGITEDGELVEIKTTSDRSIDRGWGRAGTDQVPLYYAAQVQWGLGILEASRAWLGVIHGATNGRPDLDLAIYKIDFNPAAFAGLITRGQRFIDELTGRNTP